MRVLVCGSRNWEDWDVLQNALRAVKPRPTMPSRADEHMQDAQTTGANAVTP